MLAEADTDKATPGVFEQETGALELGEGFLKRSVK